MVLQQWSDIVTEVLQDIWTRILNFVPNLLGAIIILIIGWIIADFAGWLVDRVLRLLRLPDLFKNAKVEELVQKTGSRLDATAMIASIVKWIFILVTLIAATDTLQLETVRQFLDQVLAYLPNVVSAGLILLIGTVLAHFMSAVIKGAISAANLSFVELVGNSTKYAILVFAFLAALSELGIAQAFLQALFYGIIGFVTIAGGLAFGLGGKDVAKEWLEKFKKEMQG